jgi:fumarylacetoacetase
MRDIDIKAACAHAQFGIHALPYGVFSTVNQGKRVCVRLADLVIDLFALLDDSIFQAGTLNSFMASGPTEWRKVRKKIQDSLSSGSIEELDQTVHAISDIQLHMPIAIGDYVDFFASEHHATNVAGIFRPGTPSLAPNWKRLPVGYHGRAGTIQPSGTQVKRPASQCQRAPGEASFGPTDKLDLEAEVAFVVGVGSTQGQPVSVDAFDDHVFGVMLLNDWSARDIQLWEYMPLGPHLAKSFCTSISHWVLPMDALAQARLPLPPQSPPIDAYLSGEKPPSSFDIDLEIWLNGSLISRPRFRDMYWSPAQMLAHMTVNGASIRTGDVFASGTVSGPTNDELGCMLELTQDGRRRTALPDGSSRAYLEDNDEIILRASAPAQGGQRISLGEVRGAISPSHF